MQKEQRKKAHIDYINANVNPIFEKLITDILIHKPQDVVRLYRKKKNM